MLANLSLSLRHKCVQLLAPKLYQTLGELSGRDEVGFRRPMISFLADRFSGKALVGCEVGVREGINAARIFNTLNISRLYLVDPYVPYFEPLFPETETQAYQAKVKSEAQKRLAYNGAKCVWLSRSSDDAVSLIKEELDFCYLDGDHSYTQVKRDIAHYGALIRRGGVLGGHDFTPSYMGVCRAVLESYTDGWGELQGSGMDWWMVKA